MIHLHQMLNNTEIKAYDHAVTMLINKNVIPSYCKHKSLPSEKILPKMLHLNGFAKLV